MKLGTSVGINFHITSVREGTIFNVMQFLSLEKVTGILNVSFGRELPEVTIYFVTGNVTTAEFGAIVGDGFWTCFYARNMPSRK